MKKIEGAWETHQAHSFIKSVRKSYWAQRLWYNITIDQVLVCVKKREGGLCNAWETQRGTQNMWMKEEQVLVKKREGEWETH